MAGGGKPKTEQSQLRRTGRGAPRSGRSRVTERRGGWPAATSATTGTNPPPGGGREVRVEGFIEMVKSRTFASEAETVRATDLLRQQHRMVDELFEECEHATRRRAMQCFAELADALTIHARIEEQIFYPACMTGQTKEELLE